MIANHRKKALQKLHKQAEEQALIKKLAQEVLAINDTAENEAYAKNTLKQMLEATEIDLPLDFD